MFGLRLGVSRKHQPTSIGGRHVNVKHLDGFEFIDDFARRESLGQSFQLRLQCHLQAVGEKGNEDVRFDTCLGLMVDRTNGQIVFKLLERLFHFGELHVERLQLIGVVPTQIGAQQISPFVRAHLTQFGAIEFEMKRFLRDGGIFFR